MRLLYHRESVFLPPKLSLFYFYFSTKKPGKIKKTKEIYNPGVHHDGGLAPPFGILRWLDVMADPCCVSLVSYIFLGTAFRILYFLSASLYEDVVRERELLKNKTTEYDCNCLIFTVTININTLPPARHNASWAILQL